MLDRTVYDTYVRILTRELVPALGCTEPIAIALAAAKAREVLGEEPRRLVVKCSGNIIKNAKGVIVPTTGNMRGIDTSAVLGALAGNASLGLEVLSKVGPADLEATRQMLAQGVCTVELLDTPSRLHIIVEITGDSHTALAEIRDEHTNVVRIERDGERLFYKEVEEVADEDDGDLDALNLADILEFANTVELDDIRPIIKRQIEYNTRIAQEGMTHAYGGRVGATLMRHYGGDVRVRARALAAAGSDARMGGCVLPVVINSGSGNQGLTASLPVIIYAKELGSGEEQLFRALLVSNLVTIHLKTGIGPLSAYCGATSAGCGAGAGITYLYGGRYNEIAHTVVNALAINSGMICDGAKASCAAKIASAVEAGLLGMQMQMHDSEFVGGDGIVTKGVENTIRNVGRLAHDGMAETDREIIRLMIAPGC